MWQGIPPPAPSRPGRGVAITSVTPRMAAGGLAERRLGHYSKDGIEVVTVEDETGTCTAPRLREPLIDLAGKGSCQLVVNLDKAGFPGSAGLGALADGLKRCGRMTARWIWPAPGADPEDLQDHRADEGLRHLPDPGPGHRGQEVSNSRRVHGEGK